MICLRSLLWLVWLNASASSVGFYEAIGFELVDTHLALAAS